MRVKIAPLLLCALVCSCGGKKGASSAIDPNVEAIHELFDIVTVPVELTEEKRLSIYFEFGTEREKVLSQLCEPGSVRVAVQLGASEQRVRVAIAKALKTPIGSISTTVQEPRFFNRSRTSQVDYMLRDPVGDKCLLQTMETDGLPVGRIILVAEEPDKTLETNRLHGGS